jgi:outer membrane receptor protein involved in Fe transport
MKTRPGRWVSLIISGLVLISVLPCFAGGDMAGKVIRANDSLPLAGAHIRLSGTKLGTVSGIDGTFIFHNISQGVYRVRVTYMGYQEEEKTIRIIDNQKSIATFLLISASIVAPEIEIKGKKTEKSILEIPMRINMISSSMIRDNPGQSIPQILDYVSGVNLSNTMGIFSNNNVISMRGLSGNDQGRTLVLFDDIPVNKADEGTVNWHLINKDNVDQIKVIKGPGSVIYGSNAMGGIINIKSRIPEKAISGTATIEYGTYNTFGGRFFLAGKLKKGNNEKGFLYNLNGFYTRSDGYNAEIPEYLEESDTYTVNTFLREADIGTKLGYQFNPKSSIDISLNYFNDKRGRGIQIYEVDGAYERHNTWQGVFHYKGVKGSFQWKIHAYNLTEYFERLNEFMREAEYNLYLVKSTRKDQGGLLSVSAGPFKSNLLTGGFELRMGSVDGQDIYYTSTDLISNAGKMENYGLFLQDEISLFQNRVEISIGLRLDYAVFHDGMFNIENPSYSIEYMLNYQDTLIPEHNWLQLNPKLSFQYRFTPENRIFLTLARGFRAPVLDDLCRSGKIRNGFKISNPALKPEYIDNIELGLDLLFWNKVHVSPSFYYSYGHDFMYYVSTGDSVNMGYKIDPVFQKRNISLVSIAGAEIDIGYDPFPWLELFANYSFAYSRIKDFEATDTVVDKDLDGKFLTYVPMHKASAGITWKNKIVNCNLLWKYTGSRWINDMNEPDPVLLISKFPSYNTFGFRAWHLFFKHLTVALNIDNIFDVRYVDDRLQQSPGRMIRGELTVQF